jgi:hypothetical protein
MMTLDVELTLQEEMLGTASANPVLYEEYIAGKCAGVADEEMATLPAATDELEKGTTVFHRDEDGRPSIYDYQIKGFFKDACGVLRRSADFKSKKLTAFKKVIDGLVFVGPRLIPIELQEGGKIGICTRPLRASTAQGDRVALARSETVPAGSRLCFEVKLLDNKLAALVEEWLEYGELRGLGQWRNSGKGRFTAEVSKPKPKTVVDE